MVNVFFFYLINFIHYCITHLIIEPNKNLYDRWIYFIKRDLKLIISLKSKIWRYEVNNNNMTLLFYSYFMLVFFLYLNRIFISYIFILFYIIEDFNSNYKWSISYINTHTHIYIYMYVWLYEYIINILGRKLFNFTVVF